jgi:nucleotide-binding universal stress UspA family protein
VIDRILLAVDGSQNAQRATDIAAELAGKLDANLLIVHVMMHGRPPAELVHMAEVEHLVEEAYSVISPGLAYVTGSHPDVLGGDKTDPRTPKIISALADQVVARAKTRSAEEGARNIKTAVRSGDYAEEILDAAAEYKADMIVIGSRGLGVLKSKVLGSVSQKVLHHAACNVLVVR